MLNLAPAVTAAPSTPAPTAQAPAPASPQGSFARQLNQAAAAPTPTKPSTVHTESEAAAKRSNTSPATEGKAVDAQSEPDDDAVATPEAKAMPLPAPEDASATPVEPASWLAGLLAQAGVTPPALPTNTPASRLVNPRAAKGAAVDANRSGADLRAALTEVSLPSAPAASSDPVARHDGFAAALGAAAAPPPADGTLPGQVLALALGGAAAPGHAATAAPSAGAVPVDARVDARVDSPDFAAALGTQLSVLVKDGVQHARLHLNPAALGPISVQIALDGQTAQVHMVAEQALTRQALEQAMPALASALRESGLTLTGGGVFEQPRDPGQQQAQDGTRSNPTADPEPVAVALPSVRAPRGVLDVFA